MCYSGKSYVELLLSCNWVFQLSWHIWVQFNINFNGTLTEAFIDGGTSRLNIKEIKIALRKADKENLD
jgi:hypothetical protein